MNIFNSDSSSSEKEKQYKLIPFSLFENWLISYLFYIW